MKVLIENDRFIMNMKFATYWVIVIIPMHALNGVEQDKNVSNTLWSVSFRSLLGFISHYVRTHTKFICFRFFIKGIKRYILVNFKNQIWNVPIVNLTTM